MPSLLVKYTQRYNAVYLFVVFICMLTINLFLPTIT